VLYPQAKTVPSSKQHRNCPFFFWQCADCVRELIENIGHKPVNDHPVQHIVNEDTAAFFAGIRSAEETARIIQSRVSIFLAERQR